MNKTLERISLDESIPCYCQGQEVEKKKPEVIIRDTKYSDKPKALLNFGGHCRYYLDESFIAKAENMISDSQPKSFVIDAGGRNHGTSTKQDPSVYLIDKDFAYVVLKSLRKIREYERKNDVKIDLSNF